MGNSLANVPIHTYAPTHTHETMELFFDISDNNGITHAYTNAYVWSTCESAIRSETHAQNNTYVAAYVTDRCEGPSTNMFDNDPRACVHVYLLL